MDKIEVGYYVSTAWGNGTVISVDEGDVLVELEDGDDQWFNNTEVTVLLTR